MKLAIVSHVQSLGTNVTQLGENLETKNTRPKKMSKARRQQTER